MTLPLRICWRSNRRRTCCVSRPPPILLLEPPWKHAVISPARRLGLTDRAHVGGRGGGDGREKRGCGCVPCWRDCHDRKEGSRIKRLLLNQKMGTMLQVYKDTPQTLHSLFPHLHVSSVVFHSNWCTLAISTVAKGLPIAKPLQVSSHPALTLY